MGKKNKKVVNEDPILEDVYEEYEEDYEDEDYEFTLCMTDISEILSQAYADIEERVKEFHKLAKEDF